VGQTQNPHFDANLRMTARIMAKEFCQKNNPKKEKKKKVEPKLTFEAELGIN
jgi:hypothetical protein